MSGRKAFMLRIEMEIHSIYSRKIRLWQFGNVALSVHTLSSTAVTMRVRPLFPIHFHEKLVFEKVFDTISNLSEMQDYLNKESLKMELIQSPSRCTMKPTTVAHFQTKLSRVLFPKFLNGDSMHGGRIKLQMKPGEEFKGGIGPRVEVSTKITVEEKSARKVEIDLSSIKTNWTNTEDCNSRREIGSCNANCSVCKSYSCYFDGEPQLEFCCRNRFSSDNTEKPISHRQLFYDNLELFYRQLQHKKDGMVFTGD